MKWRTVIVALCSLGCLTGVAVFCVARSPYSAIAIYTSFALAVGGIIAAVAGRSAIQALASGGGVKGAVQTLVTQSKPDAGVQP